MAVGQANPPPTTRFSTFIFNPGLKGPTLYGALLLLGLRYLSPLPSANAFTTHCGGAHHLKEANVGEAGKLTRAASVQAESPSAIAERIKLL